MKAFVALLYMLTVDCCWLFSLKITATASKLRSKSAEQLLKLMNPREVFLSPHFQICFHWNHFIFSASACQPKLWIPGKYFSLTSFIFVTTIFLQICIEPAVLWNYKMRLFKIVLSSKSSSLLCHYQNSVLFISPRLQFQELQLCMYNWNQVFYFAMVTREFEEFSFSVWGGLTELH